MGGNGRHAIYLDKNVADHPRAFSVDTLKWDVSTGTVEEPWEEQSEEAPTPSVSRKKATKTNAVGSKTLGVYRKLKGSKKFKGSKS